MIAGAYSQKDGRKRETMTEDKYKYRKHPQKEGRDDVPQSTSVLTKQSAGGGRGGNAGRKTGRPKALDTLRENSGVIRKQASDGGVLWEVVRALFFGRPDCKNSPQSHIVIVYDAGLDESGIFHSAEWRDGDWSSDGIREAWLWFFIWVESFRVVWLG
ncbi:hypothetical protein TNCV_2522811 [Trichonephila clavipes]|nr:hypothetical protein TNCV_2522811 [Trichonephila clavipes]